jgi:hypothetical protein
MTKPKCKECKFHVLRRLPLDDIDPPRYHYMCRHPAVTEHDWTGTIYHIDRLIKSRDVCSGPIWCPLAGGEVS